MTPGQNPVQHFAQIGRIFKGIVEIERFVPFHIAVFFDVLHIDAKGFFLGTAGQAVVRGLPFECDAYTVVGDTVVDHFAQQICTSGVVIGQLLPIIGLGKIEANLLDVSSVVKTTDSFFCKNQTLTILAHAEARRQFLGS